MEASDKLYFETIAEIDYYYFLLSQLYKEFKTPIQRSGVERMIDAALGFDPDSLKCKQTAKTCIQIMSRVIKLKRKIGLDEEADEQKKVMNEMLRAYIKFKV